MTKFSLTDYQQDQYLMAVNNLTVGMNMPDALKSVGTGESEHSHGLPPYHRRRAFLVDEYPACPPDWLRSSGRIKSYFVPTRDGAGLWLDFNACLGKVAHDVAIVISVQGINAITGLPCKDAQLEQYRDECPKHKKAFGPDRLCADCGFKWPKQNYLNSTGTPQGSLWLDGFRAEDGKVRQYVFTKSVERGVAAAIIGGDRVHALGISFFLSKAKRPEPKPAAVRFNSMGGNMWGGKIGSCGDDDAVYTSHVKSDMLHMVDDSGPIACAGMQTYSTSLDASSLIGEKGIAGPQGPAGEKGASGPPGKMMYARSFAGGTNRLMSASLKKTAFVAQVQQVEKLEVAAGARIDQRIHDDPGSLEDWQAEPEGLIVINYCTEADAERILAGGKVDLSGHPEGFLQKTAVGNP